LAFKFANTKNSYYICINKVAERAIKEIDIFGIISSRPCILDAAIGILENRQIQASLRKNLFDD